MASKILLLINNKTIPDPIVIKAGDVTPVLMSIVKTPAGPDTFSIKTSAPFKIDKVDGSLDATGKAIVTIGPGQSPIRGDVSCTVSLGSDSRVTASFNVRFH
jgi:hypothetical protein